MLELLNKYCSDKSRETGLMLLDMPTGIGKTYNVIQFIKNYLKSNDKGKIFFVTTLKKNLDSPYNDLLDALKGEPELQESVFRVFSNKEYAVKNFPSIKQEIKTKEILYSEEYRTFNALISTGTKNFEAYTESERKFRQLISKCLSRRFGRKEDKLAAIKNNPEWKWVGKLYPVVFSYEKRVFFVTMKKLINQFDTIVEKSVRLYENPIFKKSIVFIDEFDATKKDIQDTIVKEGLNKGIDYLDLFRNIKLCLDNPKSMPSNIFNSEVDNKHSNRDALEKNIKVFNDIEEEYHISLHHKSEGFEEKRFVLFSDLSHNNYTTGNENVTVEYNKKDNVNSLKLVPKGETLPDRKLYESLDRIKGAISYFTRFVSMLAYSYYKNKKEHKEEGKAYGEFTEFHALDTILDSLNLQGDACNIIRNMAISNFFLFGGKKKKTVEDIKDDISFYSSGFSHYDFNDNYSHDNTTVIRKFVFEETPENILYNICSLAKVVGISATATFNTVLGNYDIKHLKWKLGKTNYYEPSNKDRERLKHFFEEHTKGYGKVETIVKLTKTNSKEAPDWARVYSDTEIAEEAHRLTTENKEDTFYKENRYFKTLLAFKQFIENDIQSYLALFSKSVKENDAFDRSILLELFKNLAKDLGKTFTEDMFVTLDSDNFEQNKNALLSDLKAGKHRFVMSTYATIGAGQNLQYEIPDYRRENNDLVIVNNTRPNEKEMDFDGIYLDKPTFLVLGYDEDETNAINRVFQMENLFQIHAIDWDTKMKEIVKTYNCINNPEYKNSLRNNNTFSNLNDVKVYATKTLVQAMGRKCRTNVRGKKVYIMADSEIGGVLDKKTLYHENRMFNPEMMKLADEFCLEEAEEPETKYMEIAKDMAMLSNKRIKGLLKRCFDIIWTDNDIKMWQDVREYVLKHPTLTREEWEECPYQKHYITLGYQTNSYYYQQEGDYDRITKISDKPFEKASCVSKGDVNLDYLLKEKIKDYFIEKGYATDFESKEFIMSPPLFQNIYKGALGEAIGKFVFNYYGVELEELDSNEFEMFDFKVKDRPIYVDFKYWKESMQYNVKDYRIKVRGKALKCEGIKTVIIANVRDTENDNVNDWRDDGIYMIEMSLICKDKLSQAAAKKIQEIIDEKNTDK